MRRVVWTFLISVLAASAAIGQTVSTITTTASSNGTTLPFQRHVIRVGPSTAGAGELVAALQRQGTGGEGLDLFLSRDEGQSWSESLPVQDNPAERDMADLLADPDGNGFALLYSVEPVSSQFAVDPASDVVFLHYAVAADLSISVDAGPVVVYAPGAKQGYFRGSLSRDATGTLHATASLLDATSGTVFSWWESVSTNAGASWSTPQKIAQFGASFGGGRVTPYGSNVIAIYDDYSVADEGRYRTKAAGPTTTWGPEGIIEPKGLYHAGAFSVTSTPDGNVHLGYSDKPEEQLWYREFNGSSWSAATLMEPSGNWSNQPALSHVGNTVLFSWNHMNTATDMVIEQVTRLAGGGFGIPTIVDSVPLFKGYTNALETLTAGEPLAVLWSQDPTPPAAVSSIQCGLVSGLSGGGTPESDGGVSADAGAVATDAGRGAADSGPASDAGSAPDGGHSSGDGGTPSGIGVTVTLTNDAFVFRAVDTGGTAYATNLADQSSLLWASTDNARTWSYRGTTPNNADFKEVAALSTGTLLADTQDSSGNFTIARSANQGATWADVLPLGQYRLLSPHSVTESGGTVFLLEYQVFTNASTPIELWASEDDGQTWSERYTFQGHRHGHCIRTDPSGALWAFFGDSNTQAGIYRSTDLGNTWEEVLGGPTAIGDDAVFLSGDTALFGQDISNLPYEPYVVTLTPGGVLTDIARLPGPAYSIQVTPAGGYLLGETWEPNDTVYAAGDTSAHLLGSPDGVNWVTLGAYPTADTTNYGRADVFWALHSGEVVLTLSNVTTLASTAGYELLQVHLTGSGGGASDAGIGGGTSDAGTSDAGASDAGTSDAGSGVPVSFADSFASCTSTTSLDSSWTINGRWYCESGHARGETAGGLAFALTSALGDTKVSAAVQLDGSTGSGVVARASGSNAYAAVIDAGTGVEILAIRNGITSVLASGSASIADAISYNVELTVTGTNPVRLQALLNGVVIASATDSSNGALVSGASGLISGANIRSQYAKFVVTGTTAAP